MSRTFYILAAAVLLILIGVAVWFFVSRSPSTSTTPAPGSTFGTADNNGATGSTNITANNTQPITSGGTAAQQKIFQIAGGPVVGATFIQTLHPTTTLARYIDQTDGHVYDLPLDVAGAVPRVVSNVTIPGGVRALWVEGGNAAVMQYLDGGTVKSVYLGFPAPTSTPGTLPTKILFLPDNIVDLTASPDGKSVAYLLKTTGGINGYLAKSDGTGAKKIFTLPLSQLLISWPSQATLLVQTKSAAGVPGIVFGVDAKSGGVSPLVYADGITATADKLFSQVIYQTVEANASVRSTYVHNVKSGGDATLSFDPLPEKCLWSTLATSTMYCATPVSYVPSNFLDLWHQGVGSAADAIFLFNTTKGVSTIVASPGSDGGVPSDILEMSLSPDEHYLSFTTKGDRGLWGVRLSQ